MRKYGISPVLLVLALSAALPLGAQETEGGPGKATLGLLMGVALPNGDTKQIQDSKTSFNWGFFVNLPLISSFYIVPSAEYYGLADMNATDIDMAFKYILSFSSFRLFAGVSPGLTAVGDVMPIHVGLFAGGSMRLMRDLDAFAQAKYNVLFEGGRNMGVFHVNAGVQFEF